ncbi:LIM/homeobox protein Awh [Lingula anatina]|uniref:LIM/homeobox protein Awh n=1 Tax=Lingula anatina TaxID=7574 RepID=A0A1S3JNH1_LINAN|nr:LIM/homeobox protein Awh [Lingula anatina]|eukprot:XP_013411691.1 LIM/homeobox protein Awh [Lingula anatina]
MIVMPTTNGDMCYECRDEINDQYIFRVCGRSFHAKCLYCSVCQCRLDHQQTCYVKENSLFCKQDYLRRFGARCGKCNRNIQSNDWVRRAKEQAFHLACFACDSCKRQLSTGEEFALHEGRLLCKAHFLELLEGGDDKEYDHVARNKVKRVRTTFTEDQLHVLQANFEVDSNPDGQELERIAQITGLSKRVTQVWFQNSRARQKKTQMCGAKSPSDKKETKPNISNNNSSKHNNNNINKNDIEVEKVVISS